MPEVKCLRCATAGEGLDRPPLPGESGELVAKHVCRSCWELWRGEQVKLINENKLSPANAEHYSFLLEQMKGFLKLP